MKKILILAFFISQFSFAQEITMTRPSDGSPIVNGTVLASNVSGEASEIKFKVKNTGTTTTNVWARCQSLINNDGSNFQFCFGQDCFAEVSQGGVYPSVALTLAPNAANGNFDHFLNNNTGSETFTMDFVFKFFQTNQATQGGAEVGNSITVTYRFDPNLSIDDVNQLQNTGVIIKSTIVNNELTLDVLKASVMSIYDLNGKIVVNSNLDYGIQSIDVSNLSSGIYLVNFTNSEGKSSNKKIVKK
ncbi:MAG: T9SS type A sorting domain-containing protein [Flavobacterium sp.]|uniref:T9SS type A sorting domain-containing protein n=1 Tax=Flavobacterium sp. TaxID=239 RepID=UPI003BBAFB76